MLMAKLLIRTDRKETIFLRRTDQEYHCKDGKFSSDDLQKPDGSVISTHLGKEYVLLTAGFSDAWERFRRLPQSMIAKDIGLILTTCGVGSDSRVAEAGTGNGSLTAQLAHCAKRVYSYDLNEKHVKNARENLALLGLENVEFFVDDISTISQRDLDVLILDLPEPWEVLKAIATAVRVGGWLVTYSPSTTQVQQTKSAALERWYWVKTSEIIERTWKVGQRVCRPDNVRIGHTAFLSFFRRLS